MPVDASVAAGMVSDEPSVVGVAEDSVEPTVVKAGGNCLAAAEGGRCLLGGGRETSDAGGACALACGSSSAGCARNVSVGLGGCGNFRTAMPASTLASAAGLSRPATPCHRRGVRLRLGQLHAPVR